MDGTKQLNNNRLVFIYIAIVLVFLVLAVKLLLVVITGDKFTISGLYDHGKVSRRADIVDRNDVIVATDLKTKSLYINNALVKNPRFLASRLTEKLPDLDQAEVVDKISNKKNRGWILIKRNITPKQQEEIQGLKIAGLIFEDDRIRVYPQKSILSHIVGYVDLDRNGLSGIEMQYDKTLKSNKESLKMAMDVRVQDVLNDELLNGMAKYNALAASGVVMDVTNGEVLAVSSIPNFDPNIQSQASSNERFNRATYGVYEMGSICKIFTNTIAFEHNLVKPNDIYNVKDPIKYGRFSISDHDYVKDEMTVGEIFSYSSNIGTLQIARKIGIENQKDFFQKMGLLKKLDSDFPALGKPIYPRQWREINLITISYGHGIAISPLHIATAVSAVVNGGILYKPSFKKLAEQPEGKRVIKESTSKIMRLMMRKVVTEGTGKNADVPGYDVGGKTGTAELVELGGYNQRKTMASFVAVFPTDSPRYLVLVVFDRPNYSFNTGGMVAAPVAGVIIKNITPILGIKPKSSNGQVD